MNIKHLMPLLLSGFMLSACDKQMSESNCSSETAYKLIGQTMIDAAEKKTASERYSDTNEFIFDKAKIRASLEQLQIVVESVRTTKEDPNSSKKFCSATLKVTIPTSMLADVDQAKELKNKPKISQDARELNIDNSINVFTKKDFEFSVQPTDDGKELYVESENTIWVSLLYDITASALLKPILEVQTAEKSRKNAQEKQEVTQLKQEAEASKLEATKLSALQEKQEADSLKQDLLAKQENTEYQQTSPTTSQQTPAKKQTWTGNLGNDIVTTVTTEPCQDSEFLAQGYDYLLSSSIPIARLKQSTDAWAVSSDRATTVMGCWIKKEASFIHAKLKRKKDGKIWEQELNLNDENWITQSK